MKRIRSGMVLTVLGFLAACGGGVGVDTTSPGEGAQGETTKTTELVTTTTATATTSTAEMTDRVHASDSDLGEILVDPDGFTLYVFTADADGESTCYEACADLWPPIPADTGISSELEATIFGSTSRTDGSEQLTVNGMPLYRYTPDINPGDVTGQGFGGVWFVVDAAGNVIEESAEDEVDYGYDY